MDIYRNASAIARFMICVLALAVTLPPAHGQSQTDARTPPGNFLDLGGSKIYYEECGDRSGSSRVNS